ncbi:MAG: 6,7-dimethyl-8-ribityllumazine synthase [Alphaproteobacteria bacterium]|nr:6,7-dimethyl-8-ribityllumazine synthase [Alphaproteobacteria bacterium]
MARRLSVLIVEARYYAHISDALLKGAEAALDTAGVRYDSVTVPGAFEIPAAIALAAATRKYDGYVALGCVIRGETTHYDHVCQECARGIQTLAAAGHAIGFGVLTVENVDQAFARARVDEKDKGGEAARACLAMIALRQKLKARR